jgi:hypothetical protein
MSKKLIKQSMDEFWYTVFERKPNRYDMVIRKDLKIEDIKDALQTLDIRINHYADFIKD